MHRAYLGLGSNIDARANILSAMRSLTETFDDAAFSTVYECPAVGFEGGDFLNLVARVGTSMQPIELKHHLFKLENEHGRNRNAPRWSSRTLDVDILLYDDLYLLSPQLEIPRKEILDCAHVLKPLADLAPDLLHPTECITMSELWTRFPDSQATLKPITL
ncbi:MAG: 2-amino-4-hydroxy-6-hydroxymethyldihydropteridine diphosphokinase [Xanthomonadales bacterium]|nr:2-amino-4-hydroxy-6-hydroxymethyldihydropteridine diphosphokinase [Xanthomonadales bacterium]